MRHAAIVDDTPTPVPASEQRRIERFAHATSLDELPPELRDNPLIRHVMSMSPEEAAREHAAARACLEAEALYGDDPTQILAAIEAGTHPLQRGQRG